MMTVSRARMVAQDTVLQAIVDQAEGLKGTKPQVADEVFNIADRLAKSWKADLPAPTTKAAEPASE